MGQWSLLRRWQHLARRARLATTGEHGDDRCQRGGDEQGGAVAVMVTGDLDEPEYERHQATNATATATGPPL